MYDAGHCCAVQVILTLVLLGFLLGCFVDISPSLMLIVKTQQAWFCFSSVNAQRALVVYNPFWLLQGFWDPEQSVNKYTRTAVRC